MLWYVSFCNEISMVWYVKHFLHLPLPTFYLQLAGGGPDISFRPYCTVLCKRLVKKFCTCILENMSVLLASDEPDSLNKAVLRKIGLLLNMLLFNGIQTLQKTWNEYLTSHLSKHLSCLKLLPSTAYSSIASLTVTRLWFALYSQQVNAFYTPGKSWTQYTVVGTES